ncbi:hypothetical protein ABPG72_011142 [Tetrahymena utriculariae]
MKAASTQQKSPVQSYIIQNVKQIKVSLNNSNQLNNCMKQLILEFKNLNNLKVLLDLQTKFQGDKELLDFTINLTKIAKDIRYFVWKIQGDFTDDGQANTIGNLIGKLTNAYRLEIIINSPYFADTGANFLSRGLSKLKNLHILKIKIFPLLGKICKQLSESGIFKIQQSICSMPNLEILHYDISRSYKEIDETQQQYLFRGLPKLSNMVFTIQNDTSVEELNKIFEQEKNQLISVNYGYKFSQINNQNILQVIAFNTYIKDHMIMNPFQIFIDLLY